jgi:hypothetical protein
MMELKRTRDPLTTADFAGSRMNSTNLAEDERHDYFETTNLESRNLEAGNSEFPTSRSADPDFRGPNLVPTPAFENRPQDAGTVTPLLSDSEIGDMRSRWSTIQAEFVDEPRRSVEQADQLVATAMQRLAEGFANERASLEKQWDSGDAVSTEDLRLALQRYRAFFGRLLNAA